MSIQSLTNSPVQSGFRPETRQSGAGGPSFQEQLAETALSASGGSTAAETPVRPTLYDAQIAMLERMKLGKEKKEEEEAWDELMESIDAWIETLQGEGDLEKSARASAAIAARASERPAQRITAEDVLLNALAGRIL